MIYMYYVKLKDYLYLIVIYSFIIVLIMIKNLIFVKVKNNNIDKCFDKYKRFNYVIVFLFVLNNVGLMELKVSVLFKFVKNIKN